MEALQQTRIVFLSTCSLSMIMGSAADFTKNDRGCGVTSDDRSVNVWILRRYASRIWLVGGFKHVLFSISYMGCHPSHWRSPWFFKMGTACTTNQMIIEPLVWGWTPVMLIMDQKESTAQFLQESHQFLASKNVSSHFNPHPTCSANGIQVKMAGCVGPIKRPIVRSGNNLYSLEFNHWNI